MRIIGAGMAGLLAANVLRRHKPVVYESKQSLPSNHAALLRFRSEAVSRATGIPFKQVRVHKAMVDHNTGKITSVPNLCKSNMYAQKVAGRIVARSIMNLDPVDRWIAPHDFVEQMAKCVDVRLGCGVNLENYKSEFGPTISTMPMPELMKHLQWQPRPDFKFNPVWVMAAEIFDPEVNVYQTLYFPDPSVPIYRASITGNHLIMEFIEDPSGTSASDADRWLQYFGITAQQLVYFPPRMMKYGKIMPVDELQRKNFIFNASEHHHIYSLGRFATWRNILLDDLISDIQFIESFIEQRDLYAVQKSIVR